MQRGFRHTMESYCSDMLSDNEKVNHFDVDMIQAFSDLTGIAFQIVTSTAGHGTIPAYYPMVIPKDERILHVCHLVYGMECHYRPCTRITIKGDGPDTAHEEALHVTRVVETLRTEHAIAISECEEAVRVAEEVAAAEVVQGQEVAQAREDAAVAEAVVSPECTQDKPPNRKARKAAKRAAKEALNTELDEAPPVAAEELPPNSSRTAVTKAPEGTLETGEPLPSIWRKWVNKQRQATKVTPLAEALRQHKASSSLHEEKALVAEATRLAEEVVAKSTSLAEEALRCSQDSRNIVREHKEEVQQQTVQKEVNIQEEGQKSAGLEQPKQGRLGVVSDHERPPLSEDGRGVCDQSFNIETAPGLRPIPGAEGIGAREGPPQTKPPEFDYLEANTVSRHPDPVEDVVTEATLGLLKPTLHCAQAVDLRGTIKRWSRGALTWRLALHKK